MSGGKVAPTRVNLLRLRKQLVRVNRGATLMRRKREALVSELFRIAGAAVDARDVIEDRSQVAYAALLTALSGNGAAGLRVTSWPARELVLEISPGQVWGIPVSEITGIPPLRRNLESRQTDPALAGPAATRTAGLFEEVVDLLLHAATLEQRLRRLGSGLAQATRQLRTLEERIAPRLGADIAAIERALGEREREEHLRLRHLQRRGNPRRVSAKR
jgi:V/A-type H+/Na+-transporting ATPase subunit D